jgi:hypothetical protein
MTKYQDAPIGTVRLYDPQGESFVSNGMDAPTHHGISCAKVEMSSTT